MAKTKISEYSVTNSLNTDVGGIDIDENCLPSNLNDSVREVMVHLKEFQSGASGDAVNGAVDTTDFKISGTAVTASATELNLLDGATVTTAEINILDGVTATTTELNYTDGVTSNIQTQLNTKAPSANPTFTGDLEYTGTLTGGTGVINIGSGQVYKDADGKVGIGTSSPQQKLDVNGQIVSRGSDGEGGQISLLNVTGGEGAFIDVDGDNNLRIYNQQNTSNVFYTNRIERARINADGDLLVGTTGFAAGQNSKKLTPTALFSSRNLTTAAGHISFQNPNGQVGLISTDGSSTIYATSSDVRLKENLVPITDALTRISTIPVYRFNFIADPTKTVDGFVAHELSQHIPEAVTGEKDEVDEDGNPIHQGVDQSKLVPLLTAAVQELLEEVSTLKARIEALEQA